MFVHNQKLQEKIKLCFVFVMEYIRESKAPYHAEYALFLASGWLKMKVSGRNMGLRNIILWA